MLKWLTWFELVQLVLTTLDSEPLVKVSQDETVRHMLIAKFRVFFVRDNKTVVENAWASVLATFVHIHAHLCGPLPCFYYKYSVILEESERHKLKYAE